MSIQETYYQQQNKFLFSNSKLFGNLRKDLLKKFELSSKDNKNNESLKHLDRNILKFSYKYNNESNKINFINHDENKINIDITDGKISQVENQHKETLHINNIDSKDTSVEDRFLDFQKLFNEDYVVHLNSLMLNSGYELIVNENKDANIFLTNNISEKDLTIFQKNLISCGKNSKVKIIEEYVSDKPSNNNVVNFLDIHEGAEVIHLIFQKNIEKANFQSTSYANCHKNTCYKQLTLNISKGSVRNHHYANLLGQNSSVSLDGIFFASANQIIDNKTEINHNCPNSTSRQRYKGILTDHARASYLSKTYVDKIAQKTEAYQLSKGILLSDDSSFHSRPELRIFADDVKCSHGSTIGPIDKDLLFYLRSRGLSKKNSLSLLIKSFFHKIILDVHDKSFVEKFNYHSNIWLKENSI